MPTYEYRCPEGHEFELFQKMSDPPVAPCPECGKEAERILSAGAGLVFKGEGFYITDYKRKDEARKRERETGKAEGSGATKGTETAPSTSSGEGGGAADSSGTKGTTSSSSGSSSSSDKG